MKIEDVIIERTDKGLVFKLPQIYTAKMYREFLDRNKEKIKQLKKDLKK